MSDISSEDLRREIQAVLKDADLATISAKRVREQVEGKLNCSLLSRKKEFDKIVMEVINEQQDEEDEDDDEGKDPDADPDDESEPSEEEDPSSSEEEAAKKKKQSPKKRPQPTKHKAPKKKRKTLNADDSGTESDAGSDSDYEVVKKPCQEEEQGSRGTGSGQLSALMGESSLPRHEVVKKVWAIIKERDLYDPKNKQFAICDDELMKVMKIRRFRTFGMLKHLKPHFLD
ncbi:GD13706 [Drosophila simulans]|uniref:GD13706 n=1 Tax=Drosophila simulans TaxID=7240 RepID=B4QNL6_DROSI|nr:GD13706 [Drosophila simulans]